MSRALRVAILLSTTVLFQSQAFAQSGDQATAPQNDNVPIFRVTVVDRTIASISYRNRGGSTKLEFQGTGLAPNSGGSAEAKSEKGAIDVEAEFKHLPAATSFGPEYLTYVLWAISPEGRPVNLGEVLVDDDGNGKLAVTSALQAFGMVVTAEPYFSVSQPSDLVVLENVVTPDTNGTIEQINAKYELLERGEYTQNLSSTQVQPLVMDKRIPLELFEARNAVRIAEWTGAAQYAGDTLDKAKTDLQNAEQFQVSKGDRKSIVTMSREAVQTAEDARTITVKKEQAQQQAQQRQEQAAQTDQARADAQQANQEKMQAQAATEQAQTQAEVAQTQAQQARSEAQDARERAARAENDKAAMRARLLAQLNAVLQTRDTVRGLVVNMQDILFESGQYRLKPGAREALAKISGILLAYPGLTVEIDGYTDNIGSSQANEALSERRARAVQEFLVKQGVPPNSVSAQGLGDVNPTATNDTPIGRQLNRRVELVLSGEVIGTPVSARAQTSNGQMSRQ
jgi:outer membrane protein OmpA-like peptidoglycan-associated protein